MRVIEHKVFPSIAEVDRLNALLPDGVLFVVHDDGFGNLVMPAAAVESILENTSTLPPADVALINSWPVIDAGEEALGNLEDHIEALDTKIEELEQRLEARIEVLELAVDDLTTRVEALESPP